MSTRPYQICTKLVIDTSDPSVIFNSAGVCNHYMNFHQNVMPRWQASKKVNWRHQCEAMVSTIKQAGKNHEFDCILGLSGGLDSSYMLHMMVVEFGLRPLVFHVDGGWNSELAVHNINCLINKLKLDLYTEVINWEEMRDFQLAMFKSGVPHLDIPQDLAFIGVLYKFAQQHRITYILNGGNISTETVPIPLKYFYWGSDMRHIRDILRRFGSVHMSTYPFSSVFYHKLYLRYLRGIKVFKPLNFMPYIKAEAMQLLEHEYGWRAYNQKHYESHFTRFFEGYWLPTRFGYDVRRAQFSSLILTEQMSREDAMTHLEQKAYDPSLIHRDFDYIANKLGISSDELSSYHSLPKKFYLDYRNQHRIFQLGEWVMSRMVGTSRGGAS